MGYRTHTGPEGRPGEGVPGVIQSSSDGRGRLSSTSSFRDSLGFKRALELSVLGYYLFLKGVLVPVEVPSHLAEITDINLALMQL